MKIEVLYVPGCPNHQPALEAVTGVLAAESCQTEVEICNVPVRSQDEALALRFPGSPTIRVNGGDVEPETVSGFGLACRLYENGLGVPSAGVIRTAVAAASKEE
jgi:hypothetical protein